MSLDFALEEMQPVHIYSGNMTHNVTPMWVKAGVYDALYNSEGKIAKTIIPTLKKGVDDMVEKADEYRKLDSPNRWGLYIDALPFLKEILKACQENPDSKIWISK